jgi:DNA-binding transcriptional LysR family regulator
MMDWDKLRIFHAVADAGSYPCGRQPASEPVRVSRQIRSLEESLSTTLFHRHARG